ncbi:MAG: citrate lyase ACP [Candidatus Marinimicrobia bacterium]|nr:citrate lyase ACP [Candidatus Neomarinimicrobiota bacterium]MBT3824470.1 citrate lyase ACP [Candidatus Neomarinimicrobiota bacterium]MBT4129498.1 citrate lyase ACP [Candidatus Neomarinimicrobiota bacterium]MBT4295340.1 citrate lyase ACP [Candidatus Neomarinimicrobiota bacterium]
MSKMFQAGPLGTRIKSDCQVFYKPGPKALKIEIESKVDVLFSKTIRDLAESTFAKLGITTGDVEIKDFGALPFVMMAQIETVVKRAHPETNVEVLPEFKTHAQYGTSFGRFRRSRLYLPGNQPKLFLNAGIHQPDCIILDLEDSVPPAEKDAARHIVRNALRTLDFFGAERMVRINQGELGMQDLEAIVPHNVHTILLPKAETADQVIAMEAKVQAILKEQGLKQKIYYMPILESARGVLNAYEIATASNNNVGLAMGLEDYTADIGTQRTLEGKESFFARSMLVNAARAAGIQPIDTVFSDVSNEAALRESVRVTKSMGFDGMGCIHPRQIKPIHEEFAPAEAEILKAKRIIVAADEAEAKGLGVVAVGSKMIDPPVVKRAERTIRMAVDTGLLVENWKELD